MAVVDYIQELVDSARKAQAVFAACSQEQVDAAVRAIGKAVYDNGEALARLAVDETKMGRYEDKVLKNKGKSMAVWNHLKDKKSVGIIGYVEDKGLVEVAKPMGVVGAIMPVTNPTMTPMHNSMIALKGGNAIIVAPHPAGKKSGAATVDAMRGGLKEIGMPEDLVQCVDVEAGDAIAASGALMSLADVVVATGGPGMVKAAYSAGKPAFGVGPGNMQCLVDMDADIKDAVPKIIKGRTYDNGVLCTCEQTVICPESRFDEIIAEFEKNGAYYVREKDDVDKLRETLFPEGKLNKKAVGLAATALAEMAGLAAPEGTVVLVAKAEGSGSKDTFSKEKLFPVLAAYTYQTWEEAVSIAVDNLELEGKGHSTVVHSFTKENIEYAGTRLPVSRLLVNGIGSLGVGGAYTNGFAPTGTLGCGSWGNNSISENLDYKHLINVSRIGYTNPNAHIPTPDEIWG
ncbi:MAG: aldehyde dehydrogenase family protein [Clostridiales bacterium]|nr:aldehyde dehydrogenase family protein [Clostridiales bacterium]